MRTVFAYYAAILCGLVLHATAAGQSYQEAYRPQFHFTAEKGWLNDPNGLVYSQGEYHLFFQHNPGGTNWIEMLSWGHAISSDAIHWKQIEDQIPPTPRPDGKLAGSYSGTGFVDFNNSGNFAADGEKPIVLAWTAAGLGQCLAYSIDRGRTFTKYAGNPVIPMPTPKKKGDWDRDPDVFWYEPGKHWVLLYSVSGTGFIVNTSTDLKHWERQSVIDGFFECPGMFELPVDGDAGAKKWVVWDASGKYFIGAFDGKTFTKEAGPFLLDHGKNYYAAQSWSDVPGGRRISIGWMRNSRFLGMPFNQQMGITSELKLRTIAGMGVRLTKMPVKEVESLRYDQKRIESRILSTGSDLLEGTSGDTFDVDAEFEPAGGSTIAFNVRGQAVRWSNGKLSSGGATVDLPFTPGKVLKLRLLIDRTSIEVYGNDGVVSMTNAFLPPASDKALGLSVSGEDAKLVRMSVWRMHSIWQ